MGIRIFISHSSKDRALAKRLVGAIRTDMKIEPGEIRCTSVPGFNLTTGARISSRILREIREADAVVGLITPNSLASTYVLFELGAAWGLKKPTFPLMAKGASRAKLPEPLKETHVAYIAKRSELAQALFDLRTKARLEPKQDNPALLDTAIREVVRFAKVKRKRAKR